MFNSSNRSRILAVLAACLFLALVGAMALVLRAPGAAAVPATGTDPQAAVLQAREALRDHFEVDARHIVFATLSALANKGKIKVEVLKAAMQDMKILPHKQDPASA